MAAAVKVEINHVKIKARVGTAFDKALPALSEQILKDCNYYAKQDQGDLIRSSQTASNLAQGVLVWDTPYAARQHWEIRQASTDQNANATWRWTLVAKSKKIKSWTKLAQKEMDKHL